MSHQNSANFPPNSSSAQFSLTPNTVDIRQCNSVDCKLEYHSQPDKNMRYDASSDHATEKKKIIDQSGMSRIDDILNEIEQLSNVEKFYLYLKLPHDNTNHITDNRKNTHIVEKPAKKLARNKNQETPEEQASCVLTFHKREAEKIARQWISDHLQLCDDTSLARKDVYEEYEFYVKKLSAPILLQSDFGKVMRALFPEVKSRRLGARGSSKYCYAGLRKSTSCKEPRLPALGSTTLKSKLNQANNNNVDSSLKPNTKPANFPSLPPLFSDDAQNPCDNLPNYDSSKRAKYDFSNENTSENRDHCHIEPGEGSGGGVGIRCSSVNNSNITQADNSTSIVLLSPSSKSNPAFSTTSKIRKTMLPSITVPVQSFNRHSSTTPKNFSPRNNSTTHHFGNQFNSSCFYTPAKGETPVYSRSQTHHSITSSDEGNFSTTTSPSNSSIVSQSPNFDKYHRVTPIKNEPCMYNQNIRYSNGAPTITTPIKQHEYGKVYVKQQCASRQQPPEYPVFHRAIPENHELVHNTKNVNPPVSQQPPLIRRISQGKGNNRNLPVVTLVLNNTINLGIPKGASCHNPQYNQVSKINPELVINPENVQLCHQKSNNQQQGYGYCNGKSNISRSLYPTNGGGSVTVCGKKIGMEAHNDSDLTVLFQQSFADDTTSHGSTRNSSSGSGNMHDPTLCEYQTSGLDMIMDTFLDN